MDYAVDIDGEQGVAAEAGLSELAAMLGRLVEYVWKRTTTARIALRRKRLDALRGLISRIGVLLFLAARLIAEWTRLAASKAEPRIARPRHHLEHPPQAWAAP